MRRVSIGWPLSSCGRLQQVGPAVGDALEHRPHHLGATAAPGQAEQGPSRPEVPVRGPEAEQGRHEVDTPGVAHRRGHRLGRGGRIDQPEVVAEPFDGGPGGQHDRLDAPGEGPGPSPRHDREAAAGAADVEGGAVAHAHIEHGARAEGGLGLTRPGAGLADQRRLLISRHAGDGRPAGEGGGRRDRPGRIHDGGKNRRRDAQRLQNRVGPAAGVSGHEAGHAGIGGVGHVGLSTGEVPDDPGVHGAEGQVPLAVVVVGVEQVGQLGRRRVRRQAEALALQHQAGAGRAQVLPADSRADRLTGGAVPHHGRCPLVGDADGLDGSAGGQGVAGHRQGGLGHGAGVELHQSRRRGLGEHPDRVLVPHRAVRPDDRAAHPACTDVDNEDADGPPPCVSRAGEMLEARSSSGRSGVRVLLRNPR